MNPKLLVKTARLLLRFLLLLLGVGVAMNGWGMCREPESAAVGMMMIAAGVLLPGAEGLFLLLGYAEKMSS